jgi:hypothetical protein
MAVHYFARDDGENAKLRADRGGGSRASSSKASEAGLLDIVGHSNPDRCAGQCISSANP